MRSTQKCPECSGKRFVVMAELRVVTGHGPGMVPALMVHKKWDSEHSGTFETWTCLRCGHTALYASGVDLTQLERLCREFPEQVRVVDAEPPGQGPYR
jgi:predicted nucleic-acid-binding Zn-ribbon protein